LAKDQLTQDYIKLLDFICHCDHIDDIKSFYEVLDEFWQDQFESSPMLVYSFPKPENEDSPKMEIQLGRSFWNKKKTEIFYTKDEIEFFLSKICSEDKLQGRWKSFPMSKQKYYVIGCGESEKQSFYCMFRTDVDIHDTILDYLARYLSSSSLKLKKFDEVTKLKSLVHVDEVTGLYNQRKFLLDIDSAIERYTEMKENFSVIFIDIDHFKQVNDGHGHLVGTQLLSDVAIVLKKVLRDNDLSYRYGGDEFVVIIPSADSNSTAAIADRILRAISRKEFEVTEKKSFSGASKFQLTVSIGVAHFPEDAKDKEAIINIADKMMYMAKQSGRGRVCHARELIKEKE
jgi:diguanylate cyclase (GGDEF)-like protein